MKLTDLKPGDWVKVDDEGVIREGTVVRVSTEEHEVCIDNGIQEFWYNLEHIGAIELDVTQLKRLGFEPHETDTGAKYGKGPFRIAVPAINDFSKSELWYRDDHRHFDRPLMVHELQNLYLQMTKVPLAAD
ncbi:MAG: hypothetical protein ACK5NK_02495 [Niabella sp.]